MRLLDGYTRPVGEVSEREVDLRVIGICGDRRRLIPELRSRMEGAVLNVPSLRQRREEIPEMVRTLLQGRREITLDAITTLSDYSWDGNITELRALVDRLVSLTRKFIGRKAVLAALKTSKSCRDRGFVYKKRHLRQMATSLA